MTMHGRVVLAIGWALLAVLPGSMARGATPRAELLSSDRFEHLSPESQLTYLKELRSAVGELEAAQAASGMTFAARERTLDDLFGELLPESAAEAENRFKAGWCVVGGYGSREVDQAGQKVCPTYGRPCGDPPQDHFKCGLIFWNACVDRRDPNNAQCGISCRCQTEAERMEATWSKPQLREKLAGYRKIKGTVEELNAGICTPNRYVDACTRFGQRIVAMNKLESLPHEAASPPAPPPNPPPPNPPVAAKPPAPAPTGPCKRVFGVVLEGTARAPETHSAEASFHQQASRWASAFGAAGAGSGVYRIPPGDDIAKVRGVPNRVYQALMDDLTRLYRESPAKVCEKSMDFVKQVVSPSDDPATGSAVVIEHAITNADFAKYGDADGDQLLAGNSGAVSATGGETSYVDVTQHSLLDGHFSLKAELEALKGCGGKEDVAVMVSVGDHGVNVTAHPENGCFVYLSGGRKLTPQMAFDNIVKPLGQQGARVFFNVNACFSGCFQKKLAALIAADADLSKKTPACLTSQTSDKVPGYGSDGMMGGTYDATYPYFLAHLKEALADPFNAQLCAMAMDPFNDPQLEGGGAVPAAAEVPNLSCGDPDAAFVAIGKATGKDLSGLSAECERIRKDKGFPRAAVAPVPSGDAGRDLAANREYAGIVKAIFQCADVRKILDPIPGIHEFFLGLDRPDSWPGLRAVCRMVKQVEDPAIQARALQSIRTCSLPLKDYRVAAKNVEAAPAAGDGRGANQVERIEKGQREGNVDK